MEGRQAQHGHLSQTQGLGLGEETKEGIKVEGRGKVHQERKRGEQVSERSEFVLGELLRSEVDRMSIG